MTVTYTTLRWKWSKMNQKKVKGKKHIHPLLQLHKQQRTEGGIHSYSKTCICKQIQAECEPSIHKFLKQTALPHAYITQNGFIKQTGFLMGLCEIIEVQPWHICLLYRETVMWSDTHSNWELHWNICTPEDILLKGLTKQIINFHLLSIFFSVSIR